MTPAIVLRAGRWVHLVDPSGHLVRSAPIAADAEGAGRLLASSGPFDLPADVRALLAASPAGIPWVADPWVSTASRVASRSTPPVGLVDLRRARDQLPAVPFAETRTLLLAQAAAEVERMLRDPQEVLITLAREEERVERSYDREVAAAGHWVDAGSAPLGAYSDEWKRFRERYEEHLAGLARRVEEGARAVVPNLTALVGPRVAARLVAAAGGREALGRMTASRLQLLGSRRRPSSGRGPRYGLLFRANRMQDVPLDRAGAYARSLAALAVIAARADGTGNDIADLLTTRRDRRISALRGRRR